MHSYVQIVTTHQAGQDPFVLKYEQGSIRLQTDGEYKLLILLIDLSRTIECETLKNHIQAGGCQVLLIWLAPIKKGSSLTSLCELTHR